MSALSLSEQIRAAVERETGVLIALGRSAFVARQGAVDIVRSKVRNSVALVATQNNVTLCHVCGERNDDTQPVVAVLQPKGAPVLWMHAGTCHDEHIRLVGLRVEAIMAAAGYGADRREDAA